MSPRQRCRESARATDFWQTLRIVERIIRVAEPDEADKLTAAALRTSRGCGSEWRCHSRGTQLNVICQEFTVGMAVCEIIVTPTRNIAADASA